MRNHVQFHRSGLARLFCIVALCFLFMTSLAAKELRLASGVPPLHPGNDPLYTEFTKLLPEYSDGALSGSILGSEVTTVRNMRAAIRSGLVEVGLFLPAYFPADLPNFNLIGDLSMYGGDPQVTAAAATEYMLTCSDCLDEFSELGAVYTSTHSTDGYRLLSKKKVINPEDLKGMRIRVATPQHSRWVEAMGARPISLAAGEVFEALSQGIIDATIASISDLRVYNLSEVISHATLIDLGTFRSTANHTVKSSVWQKFTETDRKAFFLAAFKSSILATHKWKEMADSSRNLAEASKIPLLDPSPELEMQTVRFKGEDLVKAVQQAQESFKISDAKPKIARFQELVEKWDSLLSDVQDDPESILDIYRSEILSKIDLANYGQ